MPVLLFVMLGSALAEKIAVRLDDVVGVYRNPVVIRRPDEIIRTENVLEIIRYDQTGAYVRTRLNHPVTGNLCSFWGIAEIQGSRLLYRSIGNEGETSSRCDLAVRIEKGEILFDDRDRQCERQLCGANAHFSQSGFKRSGRQRITYLERIRKSRQYQEAAAEYQRLKGRIDLGPMDNLTGRYQVPVTVNFPDPKRPFRTRHLLEIIPYREGSLYINAEINGHHACYLSGIAEVEGSRLVYRSVPGEDDPLPACTFSLQLRANSIVLHDADGACRRLYCGVSAGFDGVSFRAKLRRPISNLSKTRSSVSYEEAVAEYERLLLWRAAQPAPIKQP
ncbi:hypothetical protein VB618_06745 [Microvirga sp. CF3062]|uniref:hypothetical protein n=1 Tax=Microvirga sp. CF3062 TaxID=3110182 RepID=UPI002E75BC23|nr:hypothetical protein [Microvirga sp. CF3062]MEE1655887.1 hypothetical protein [Microvirga sp. CF3062]